MKLFIFVALLASVPVLADDYAHHPSPRDPLYLQPSLYPQLKSKVPAPPKKGSAGQKKDEETLLEYQSKRTEADCERAKSEVKVNLQTLFGKPEGPLDKKEVEALYPFFEQLRNDADFFIQQLKKDFPRPRPYTYIEGLTPCIAKEITLAYPSGHALLAKLNALVLSDFFPKKKSELETRAKTVGDDRILAGIHHPSDVESGRTLGALLYEEFKKSKKYKEDFEKYRSKL